MGKMRNFDSESLKVEREEKLPGSELERSWRLGES
jgi:hypothetical protein